jgi:uncharacterized membrane protein
MLQIFVCFYIYAFFGWCIEVAYQQLRRGKFINRGMLAGPYCPIYGFGMVFLILCTRSFADNFFALFFVSAFLCSALELVAGFLLEKLFHERWWDYSDEPMNIGGYICLRFSIAWGIGGAIAIKEVHPLIERFVLWLPEPLLVVIVILLTVSMLADAIVTVVHIVGLNRQVDNLIKIQKNLRIVSDKMGEQISYSTAKSSNKVKMILDKADFQQQMNKVHEGLNRTQKRLLKSYPNLKGTKSELQEKILRFWTDKSKNDREDL